MQERHADRRRYFQEQARTTEKYYLPHLNKQIGFLPTRVLEVGCGEGGNLLPFARLGCEVVGVDLSPTRIAQAREFFAGQGQRGEFIVSDISDLQEFPRRFPLILVHDVVEHIAHKESFLRGLKRFLAPGGVVFLAFPAWQMPFGGHQQIARSRIASHLPFIHLLPAPLYRRLLQVCGEEEGTIRELLYIRDTRCTIEQFREAVFRSGYRVADELLYLINPHYETKFGWKPRRLCRSIGRVPVLRNYFSSSCFYVLRAVMGDG